MTSPARLGARTYALARDVELVELAAAVGGDVVLWSRHGEGFVAWGRAGAVEPGAGAGRFAAASAAARALLAGVDAAGEGPGPLVAGSFSFAAGAPTSWLVLPAVVVRRTAEGAWLTVTGPGAQDAPAGPGDDVLTRLVGRATAGARRSVPWAVADRRPRTDAEWTAAVAAARRAIHEGRLLKVVLARDVVVDAPADLDATLLARRLAARYPQCWTFVCGDLVGASPELLVGRHGAEVHSLTLAGSAPRGGSPDADEAAGRALLASRKDRWEHELAVRFVREVLARCCSELWVDPEPSLLRLANVQHLATESHGLLGEPLDAVELAGRLHPGAAVCGTPKSEALALIDELEGMDRGHYAAPVGWMDASGNGEWAIALRCAEVAGRRARLFAGAGIVAESEPEAELEETRLKLRPMLAALGEPDG